MNLGEQSERTFAVVEACKAGKLISFRHCDNVISAEFFGQPSDFMVGKISAFRYALSAFYRTDIDIVSAAPGCLVVRFGLDSPFLDPDEGRHSSAAIYASAIHRAMQECRVVRLTNKNHVAYVRSSLRSLNPPRDHWEVQVKRI